jgi:hypothetical protein
MALWGNNDNVDSVGTVSLDYSTLIVTGSGTSFGNAGSAKTGDVIRFGFRDASSGVSTYFGDAVIVGIASTTQLTIGSTAGLSGGGIAGTSFTVSESPVFTTWDSHYSQNIGVGGTTDKFVYGISTSGSQVSNTTAYETGVGWVGITTYNDAGGNLRVKKEILVAMSGITTGNRPVFPDQK